MIIILFFSFRSSTKNSGNYGLGDIISSLQWIKKNIQHFGGHPGQITVLARGSGATLVTALTASPMAKDLFKQAWVSSVALHTVESRVNLEGGH